MSGKSLLLALGLSAAAYGQWVQATLPAGGTP